MKSKILTLAAVATAIAAVNVNAHDRCWSPVHRIVGGVVAGTMIARALEPRPVYVAPPPTVVYQTVPTTTTVVTTYPPTVPNAPTIPNAPTVVTTTTTTTTTTQPATTVIYAPAPAPVVYAPAPVYYAPPRVSFGISFGHGEHHHHRSHHRHW